MVYNFNTVMKKILFVISLFTLLFAGTAYCQQSEYKRSITSLLVCEGKMKVLVEQFRPLLFDYTRELYPSLDKQAKDDYTNRYLNTKFLHDVTVFAMPFYEESGVTLEDMTFLIERYQNDGLSAVKAVEQLNSVENIRAFDVKTYEQMRAIAAGKEPVYTSEANCPESYKKLFWEFWEAMDMDQNIRYIYSAWGDGNEASLCYLGKEVPVLYLNAACQTVPEVHLRYFINLGKQDCGQHARAAKLAFTTDFAALRNNIFECYKVWLAGKL